MEAVHIFVVSHNAHKTMWDCAGCWQFGQFEQPLVLALVIFWLLKASCLQAEFRYLGTGLTRYIQVFRAVDKISAFQFSQGTAVQA